MTKQPNQHAIIEQIHAHLRVFVVVQKHGARCFNPPLITNQKKYVQWPDCFFGVPEIEAWDILWDDLRLKLKPSLQHQFPSVERIGIRKLLMLSQKVWRPFNPHLLKQLRLSWARTSWQVGMSSSSCEAAHPPIFHRHSCVILSIFAGDVPSCWISPRIPGCRSCLFASHGVLAAILGRTVGDREGVKSRLAG